MFFFLDINSFNQKLIVFSHYQKTYNSQTGLKNSPQYFISALACSKEKNGTIFVENKGKRLTRAPGSQDKFVRWGIFIISIKYISWIKSLFLHIRNSLGHFLVFLMTSVSVWPTFWGPQIAKCWFLDQSKILISQLKTMVWHRVRAHLRWNEIRFVIEKKI